MFFNVLDWIDSPPILDIKTAEPPPLAFIKGTQSTDQSNKKHRWINEKNNLHYEINASSGIIKAHHMLLINI